MSASKTLADQMATMDLRETCAVEYGPGPGYKPTQGENWLAGWLCTAIAAWEEERTAREAAEKLLDEQLLAAKTYMAYMMGWGHGAAHRPMDTRATGHENTGIRDAYATGYRIGLAARNIASADATQRTGYTPSISRSPLPSSTKEGA